MDEVWFICTCPKCRKKYELLMRDSFFLGGTFQSPIKFMCQICPRCSDISLVPSPR